MQQKPIYEHYILIPIYAWLEFYLPQSVDFDDTLHLCSTLSILKFIQLSCLQYALNKGFVNGFENYQKITLFSFMRLRLYDFVGSGKAFDVFTYEFPL